MDRDARFGHEEEHVCAALALLLLPAPHLTSDAVPMYGNIEDLLVSATMVTPTGVITKPCNVPRTSTGPNINEMIIGSEGSFGFVSEAVFRIRPLPELKEYLGFLFPSFEHGCAAMRDVAYRCVPCVAAGGSGGWWGCTVCYCHRTLLNPVIEPFHSYISR